MERKILLLIVMVLTLFAYQNCYKPKSSQDAVSSSSQQEIILADESLQQISFYNKETEQVQKSGNTFSLVTNNQYKIDLVSGKIEKFSAEGQKKSEYCLTSELLNELSDLLSSSKICKKSAVIQDGVVCAQVLQSPYATLVTNREEFNLGYASDSCGTLKIDLCEEAPSMAKGWWTYVYTNLAQLNCSSQ